MTLPTRYGGGGAPMEHALAVFEEIGAGSASLGRLDDLDLPEQQDHRAVRAGQPARADAAPLRRRAARLLRPDRGRPGQRHHLAGHQGPPDRHRLGDQRGEGVHHLRVQGRLLRRARRDRRRGLRVRGRAGPARACRPARPARPRRSACATGRTSTWCSTTSSCPPTRSSARRARACARPWSPCPTAAPWPPASRSASPGPRSTSPSATCATGPRSAGRSSTSRASSGTSPKPPPSWTPPG